METGVYFIQGEKKGVASVMDIAARVLENYGYERIYEEYITASPHQPDFYIMRIIGQAAKDAARDRMFYCYQTINNEECFLYTTPRLSQEIIKFLKATHTEVYLRL